MIRIALLAALAPALAIAQSSGRPGASPPPSAQPRAPSAAPPRLAALLKEIDATYARRDDPAQLAIHRTKLAEAEKLAPNDYDVLWRLSRLNFWLADDPSLPGKEKSRLGKMGWDYGDRASAANPSRVEGWYFAAGGVGNYALGIGVITALRQGIEGKFKERLSRAESIDANYLNGAIQVAWGRFWYELPWPKYNAGKSKRSYEAALKKNPFDVRAHVYLAELDLKEDKPDGWREEMEKAVATAPGRYDAPEERRWQDVARRMLADPPVEAR